MRELLHKPTTIRESRQSQNRKAGGAMKIHLIYCAGDNERHAAIADEEAWWIGVRSNKHAYNVPIRFIDNDYHAPDFKRHLEMVKRFSPHYATVPDLSEQEVNRADIDRALQQADQLSQYCETVFIVPKLTGQIAMLPEHLAIGYSVPTSYGGAQYPLWELEGRKVHLLGGSPHEQIKLYRYIACYADVVSADGNMFQLISGFGKYWKHGQWVEHPKHGLKDPNTTYQCIAWSLRNI